MGSIFCKPNADDAINWRHQREDDTGQCRCTTNWLSISPSTGKSSTSLRSLTRRTYALRQKLTDRLPVNDMFLHKLNRHQKCTEHPSLPHVDSAAKKPSQVNLVGQFEWTPVDKPSEESVHGFTTPGNSLHIRLQVTHSSTYLHTYVLHTFCFYPFGSNE